MAGYGAAGEIADGVRPLVIAHRGASARAPENTLAAFEMACRAGAAMLETDARLTADGAVVLLHDATLERTTDGAGRVSEMSLAAVRAVDAGYRFRDAGGDYPWRGRGTRMPTLAETLLWLAEQWPAVRLNVEIKHDGEQEVGEVVAAVVAVIDAADAGERVLVSSFSREVLQAVRATRPTLAGALICGADADLAECIAWSAAQRLVAVHPHHALLAASSVAVEDVRDSASADARAAESAQAAKGLVRLARAVGLAVHVWTVNAPARMLELAGAGVSGIMSDDPDLLRLTLRC